ncbi:response regulator transcription factor [Gordonia sp. TBRC 11910]|uniref:Response regulator transcription factor n=1 Tax=Gordonia asplenii TaxID=2725283 RepID=A0A848KZ48_9ACTN|nr:LytTR family DNA-binding domain-containing protein [Gordonia asplenii]NMO00718.1 response regulator transcription factor [Gordonia asplenii]
MPLVILAVDDEPPALDELQFLLSRQPGVGEVITASDATDALRQLNSRRFDAVFLDINMPGLSGLELAGVLTNFNHRPAVVFVTAHDDRAVDAFGVGAVDYLLKPLREERLAQAITRVRTSEAPAEEAPAPAEIEPDDSADVVPVELGGVTTLVPRDSISWVEAVGDYARLHSASGAHLVRIPLSTLETRWRGHGFIRIHRSYLVALPMVTGLRARGSTTTVSLRTNGAEPAVDLPVSRRQVRDLKDRLVRDPMRSYRAAERRTDV